MSEMEERLLAGLEEVKAKLIGLEYTTQGVELQLRTLNGKVAQHQEFVNVHKLEHAVAEGVRIERAAQIAAAATMRANTALTWGAITKIGSVIAVVATVSGVVANWWLG
jgi:tetrahydrodipicolinate N-succinyltransferase